MDGKGAKQQQLRETTQAELLAVLSLLLRLVFVNALLILLLLL